MGFTVHYGSTAKHSRRRTTPIIRTVPVSLTEGHPFRIVQQDALLAFAAALAPARTSY